ncbi:hypothetical protein CPLU01_11313 [Colletotrichum plurivorum]|uniref:F-box domain-containing protein n=1 Tax=Colletotrichum plurivorum TaxID=2175906 RepID=A0A8H6K1W2_9PEZI|nr:hypothetical protein CPLU01_11313 [Colletotrichum plurivorum]
MPYSSGGSQQGSLVPSPPPSPTGDQSLNKDSGHGASSSGSHLPSVQQDFNLNRVSFEPGGESTAHRPYDPDEDEVESQDEDWSDTGSVILPKSVIAPKTSRKTARKQPITPKIVSPEDQSGDESDEESEIDDEDAGEEDDDEGGQNIDDRRDEEKEQAEEDPPVDLERAGCTDTCRHDIQQTVDHYRQRIEALQVQVQVLTTDRSPQTEEIRRPRNTRRLDRQRNSQRTWPELLRVHLGQSNDSQAMSYAEIYKRCCQEENMSSKVNMVHPGLRLRGPTPREIEAAIHGLPDGEPDADSENQEGELFVPNEPRSQPNCSRSFPFDRLPNKVQANILRFVFALDNKLIHCLSRLDYFVPPDEPIGLSHPSRSGLPHRFHLSGMSCNVTYAVRPNDHLAPLLVCKEWYFIGVHAFYGLNTFAFSSLGEFACFCKGIGRARRERLQHVEILWLGSQSLVYDFVTEGRSRTPRYTSRRTWGSSILCELIRLKSLTIHINESGSQYTRRRHEPMAVRNYMASQTAGQPNFRPMRQLRTLQGLDFIHQLRGMELVRFYDFGRHLQQGGRHPIRDWSFGEDVERVTALAKTPEKAEEAELRKLTPFIHGFELQDELLEFIEKLYKESSAFDTELAPRTGVTHPTYRQRVIEQSDEAKNNFEVSLRTIEGRPRRRNNPSVQEGRADFRADSLSDGAASNGGGQRTPRASAQDARSITTYSESITAEGSIRSDDGDSLAGSNVGNPIDLDHYEPRFNGLKKPNIQSLERVKREQTYTTTASSDHLFVRQDSYDSRVMRREMSMSVGRLLTPSSPVGQGPPSAAGDLFVSQSPPAFSALTSSYGGTTLASTRGSMGPFRNGSEDMPDAFDNPRIENRTEFSKPSSLSLTIQTTTDSLCFIRSDHPRLARLASASSDDEANVFKNKRRRLV